MSVFVHLIIEGPWLHVSHGGVRGSLYVYYSSGRYQESLCKTVASTILLVLVGFYAVLCGVCFFFFFLLNLTEDHALPSELPFSSQLCQDKAVKQWFCNFRFEQGLLVIPHHTTHQHSCIHSFVKVRLKHICSEILLSKEMSDQVDIIFRNVLTQSWLQQCGFIWLSLLWPVFT